MIYCSQISKKPFHSSGYLKWEDRKTRKILVCTLMAVLLCSSMAFFASAEETEGKPVATTIPVEDFKYEAPVDLLKDYVPTDMDFLVDTMVTRSAMTQIKIVEVGDRAFQDKYSSNWMWQMHRAACDADSILEQFGVQFVSAAQKSWTSTTSDPGRLLQEVAAFGLPNGARLVMGFTGRPNNINGTIWGGIGYMPGRHTLVWDQDINYNRTILQHEIGHNYGIDHCSRDANCIMSGWPFNNGVSNYNRICSTDRSYWQQHRNDKN